MDAETIHCQNCGAAVSTDAPVCAHCGARLATISCPSCFGMMFRGMRFCPQCGAPAVAWRSSQAALACPACAVPMLEGSLQQYTLHECEKCFGIWLDSATFERICHDAEQQAAVLSRSQLGQPYVTEMTPVVYRRCPVCRDIMTRMNFAHCSGVVVDVCSAHGTWFDLNELQRIVLFIRSGGLDRMRQREKEELAHERSLLQAARLELARDGRWGASSVAGPDLLCHAVNSAAGLLGTWLKR